MDFLTPSQWFELVFSLIGVIGVYLVAIKKKSGFLFLGLGQALFVLYFYCFSQYFLVIQNIILFGFNIFGYLKWRKGERNGK